MKNSAFIILIFVFLFACKKDIPVTEPDPVNNVNGYDTLKPLNYYPVYPGSYWKYLENDTDTVIHSTSSSYLPHSYLSYKGLDGYGNYVEQYSDTVYVPFLNNNPIYQYHKIQYVAPPFGGNYTQWPILSETVGFQFERNWEETQYGDFREHVKVVQKTVNNDQDSVIILKGHWVLGPNINKITTEVYIKDIGLSSHFLIDTVAMDTINKLQLINYHINK